MSETDADTILECGHPPTRDGSAASSISTGYGTAPNGERHCYACCAEQDKAQMIRDGKSDLYLTKRDGTRYEVSNWPGSLRLPVTHFRESKTNGFGRMMSRTDVWFTGPDGKPWYGRHQGDFNQCCRVRRIK